MKSDEKFTMKSSICNHVFHPIYEDDILMGMIYYGDECSQCGATRNTGPGPLDLGTYQWR